MLGYVYREPPVAPPDQYPCLSCRMHGPYCADTCRLLDAWREAQPREARPQGETAAAGQGGGQ